MSVLKYKDPVTGEIRKVGSPSNPIDSYTKNESDKKYAPSYTYGTEDLVAGESALETGKLYFIYE